MRLTLEEGPFQQRDDRPSENHHADDDERAQVCDGDSGSDGDEDQSLDDEAQSTVLQHGSSALRGRFVAGGLVRGQLRLLVAPARRLLRDLFEARWLRYISAVGV